MAEVALAAESRGAQGSANSRRLRASGKIPAVVYGHGTEPLPVAVNARSLRQALNTDAGVNALINLEVEGKKMLALTREIQRHPVRGTVAHVDFLVVNRDEQVSADVPITFIGEAPKVTKMGGLVEHQLTALTVVATPTTLPAHIEVNIEELELEGAIRVRDIALPKGVVCSLDPEEPIVVGKATRGAKGDEEEGESAESAEA